MTMDESEKSQLAEPHTSSKRRVALAVAGFSLLGLALALLIFGAPLLGSGADDDVLDLPQISTTAAAAGSSIAAVSPLAVGDKAHDFTLSDANGSDVSLSDFAGQPVVVNFWATWCPPCRLEMPELQNAYDTYRDQGLVVLAVNAQETEPQVRAFFDEMGFTLPALLDSDGQVGRAYGTPGLPSTFFIDGSGEVTAVHRGLLTAGLIETYLAQILP
jgi:cytochrome c biogenesis protein CcmG/thiol:disulfide interchange protein DsbE